MLTPSLKMNLLTRQEQTCDVKREGAVVTAQLELQVYVLHMPWNGLPSDCGPQVALPDDHMLQRKLWGLDVCQRAADVLGSPCSEAACNRAALSIAADAPNFASLSLWLDYRSCSTVIGRQAMRFQPLRSNEKLYSARVPWSASGSLGL